jgi:hypothetical protein
VTSETKKPDIMLFGCLMMSADVERAGALLTERDAPLTWQGLAPIMGLDFLRCLVSWRDPRRMSVHRRRPWKVSAGGASRAVRARVS